VPSLHSWAFTTLTTVGYGDIVPHTTQERVFAMFLILAGAVTFGAYVMSWCKIHSVWTSRLVHVFVLLPCSIVGKISSLSASMNKREVAAQEQLTALDEFLKFYSLPRNLRHHTRRYHQLLSRLYPFRRENLLEDMSPFMRRAVQMHLYKDLLHSQPVLKFAAVGFQAAVVSYIQPSFCLRGAFVCVRPWWLLVLFFVCCSFVGGSLFSLFCVLSFVLYPTSVSSLAGLRRDRREHVLHLHWHN